MCVCVEGGVGWRRLVLRLPLFLSLWTEKKKGSLLHQLITRAGERRVRHGEVKRVMGILWHSKD